MSPAAPSSATTGGCARPSSQAIAGRARAAGADAIVTTAKDAVRLPPAPLAPPVLVLEIAAEIADEARFRERLLAAVARGAAA